MRPVALIALLFVGGCIFGQGKAPDVDTGEEGDAAQPSDMDSDDMPATPDMGVDAARDQGPSVDSSAPDVPVDMPVPDVGFGDDCDSSMLPPPPRCNIAPEDADWWPASVVQDLTVAYSDSCCFDVDDDGEVDNMLGDMLGAFGETKAQNDLDAVIADGRFVLIFEYVDLDGVLNDDSFRTHPYRGTGSPPYDVTGNTVRVSSEDLVGGSYPAHQFSQSMLSDGMLDVRGGQIWLPLPLPGAPALIVPVIAARMEVEVQGNTALPSPGVEADGKVGGAVELDALYEALNDVAKGCACLQVSDASPYISADGECRGDLSDRASDCRAGGADRCADLGSACEEYSIFTQDADIATGPNADERNALSIGYEVKLVPAEIDGASP